MINISCLKLKTYDPVTLNFKILVEVSLFIQTVYQVCLPDAFHFWWRAQVSLQIKDWKKYWHFWSYWGSLHNYAFSNPKLRLKAPVWLDKYFRWFVSYSDPKEHHYQYVLLIFFNSKAFPLKKNFLQNYKEQGFFMRFSFISIFIYMRKLVWDKWIG